MLSRLNFDEKKDKIISMKDILLNNEELEKHAQEIAKLHTVVKGKKSTKLLKRVDYSFKSIVDVYLELNKKNKTKNELTPASDWLLDNFYKIEEQVKEVKQILVNDRNSKFNILDKGFFKGYPRVYVIAMELVSHTDGRIDEEVIKHFVNAYQSVRVLSIEEIWSISLMLQISLIENIRIICEKIYNTEMDWLKAEEAATQSPEALINTIKENVGDIDRINSSYIEHLLRKLRHEGIDSGDITNFIEKKLSDYNMTVSRLIEDEHKSQAARKISIGNSITSINAIAAIDWNELSENLSIVEKILRSDPSKVYPLMDFESRDYYRSNVIEIASQYKLSEIQVAKEAIHLAEKNNKIEGNDKTAHVGYYIIDGGKQALIEALGVNRANDQLHSKTFASYISPILVITAIITSIMVYYVASTGTVDFMMYLLTIMIVLIPASDIGVVLTNWIYTKLSDPYFIPRFEYKEEIPVEATTLVVIPTLLPNPKRARELLEMLEVYYLANREENLYFALVGDFKDDTHEELAEDNEITNTALNGVKKLNQKYSKEKDLFYFFHRRRQYCQSQNRWMGWERKRGALIEMNQLIKGSESTSFTTVSGNIKDLADVKYVITLDADTILPLDTAKKLIGMMMHPLNKAIIDEKRGIVKEGYGLIQPKISNNIESVSKSIFTRIYGGEGGLDSYVTLYSDVYQDLFHEGIFTGKGIFDIEIFNKLLKEAIPDHTVLSHDLLEGSYLRTGLATDLELIDGFPSKYSSYMKRLHRWVRGDWQLIRWLPKTIKDRNGETVENPLTALSKWKIIDNLRRSLVAISILVLIIGAASFLPGSFMVWLLLALVTILMPFFTGLIDYIRDEAYNSTKKINCKKVNNGITSRIYHSILTFIFLPYEAAMMLDAIFRTIYRVVISKKNLLEWVTVADVEINLKGDIDSFINQMKAAIYISIAVLVKVLIIRPTNLIYILPIGILWTASPVIAYYTSKEIKDDQVKLPPEEEKELRRIARKTWAYFEDFVNEENFYLPPDNYQLDPENGVAHRTSPTNIGFFLMSVLAARDLGYLTTSKMVGELKNTVNTIKGMETWKGHLYNWYDTRTLKLLRPSYVSTVDSGNFITYLITVKAGLEEYLNNSLINTTLLQGILDTLHLTEEHEEIATVIEEALNSRMTLSQWHLTMEKISFYHKDNNKWEQKINSQIVSLKKEIEYFLPSREHLDTLEIFIDHDKLQKLLDVNISITDLDQLYGGILNEIRDTDYKDKETEHQLDGLKLQVEDLKQHTIAFINDIHQLMDEIQTIIDSTEFAPLYNPQRNLFSIGYNVEEERLTNSYYDLLASEVRTTSYIAIARKEIPKKHWFKMGRRLTLVNGCRGLVSWTGTMFEYFMPYLVMKNYKNTVWDETYETVIRAQKKFGQLKKVPWGVSESGYYAFDMQFNYQYQAFGVPDLGLKRGLIDYTVVSPYSTLLALPIKPKEVLSNMRSLIDEGLEGEYGLYEAIDYSPVVLKGNSKQIIKSFMAHHQGMIFVSLDNYFNNKVMQKRFHSQPIIKTAELLLQEKKSPHAILTNEYTKYIEPVEEKEYKHKKAVRVLGEPEGFPPKSHLLSNGQYSVMITASGSGYSRLNDMQITRWREDAIEDRYGSFIFIRNVKDDSIWSATYEPIYEKPDGYKVILSEDRAEFFCRNDVIETHTEIAVSPEDQAEIRKVTLTNHGNEEILLELTSYQEAVLNLQAADLAHPAFSNLFVTTEVLTQYNALLATRKKRELKDKERWMFHTITENSGGVGVFQYETTRGSFIGRSRTISNPAALTQPLTNTVGIAIDPILSLRKTVKIEGGRSVEVSFITGVGDSRDEMLELVRKYKDFSSISRGFQLAYTRSQVEASFLNLLPREIVTYQDMISELIYLSPLKRKFNKTLENNNKGQSGLWAYGISGDLPVLLVTIGNASEIDLVKEALKAHEYYRTKGLTVDLVILNEDESNYLQSLQGIILDLVMASHGRHIMDQRGGIFVRNASMMPQEDIYLLYTVARIILKGGQGSIGKQLSIIDDEERDLPREKKFPEKYTHYESKDEPLELDYFNGYGGFSRDGSEYVIKLKESINTPAPWINVVANEKFGFLVSESSAGAIWSENSRENKLTPWSNDPISDPPSEVVYIRDDDTGSYWSITPLPIREKENYIIHHGAGYTTFDHNSQGINQNLTMFVPKNEAVKLNIVTLKNTSNKTRKLTLTYYVRPVLGIAEELTQRFIKTWKTENGALALNNPYNSDFGGNIAFVGTTEEVTSFTCDRREFIGLNGSLAHPVGLKREGLANRIGAGLDPCIALQVTFKMEANEEKELGFFIGQEKNEAEVQQIITKYMNINSIRAELKNVQDFWRSSLDIVKVKTPDLSMDLMLNQWLLYQTVSCRLWARSAFYQSGGAYGYRDQLQDVMSMTHLFPQLVKKQILLHSEHQFLEGDVQHWWHPGAGEKGIRTRFSDDLLWLPFVTAEYIEKTKDYKLLQEEVYFLEEAPLQEGEDERYGIPQKSTEKASVYEHCIRAIERSLKFGENGIPLMGSGDWNDGMNTVGNEGKGESVWLGWFIYSILNKFAPLMEKMKDSKRAEDYLKVADKIAKAIEENAWDGEWYVRAFYDDGSPLGSSKNTECIIDSLAQSWSIISGGGNEERKIEAMKSVENYLIKKEEGMILLFTPPFDKSDQNPGYIKGYVPGVRENGGQYSHAAAWVINAYAAMGNGDKAWELFNMINPINHARTPLECATYKVEPYVMAADVYAVSPHVGRGGWTWYTGVAGWMYRIGIEYILGIKKKGNILSIEPCIPKEWNSYTIRYQFMDTSYIITVNNPKGVNGGVKEVKIDGKSHNVMEIQMENDGLLHEVEIVMGS
ncbi:GH36-type glycosyl hydrolase domain-containing protein [Alkaliphilus peptidifermentans]|uniref:Cellobiose phosphorylase n=1 Tax=Alkaliphilus peptidifermentans DSM 18978 TaxID=1120976 RepID=A0A1G5KAH1_9FIRM|nr:glucoamylase family protein [Alkaliphilus peptidifermentans]SCY97010.1 Cellobiose phosphorylase [Alkaliphilus peptidifermentans DSM 18978]